MNNGTATVEHRFFAVRASALNDTQTLVNGTGHVCLAITPSPKSPTSFKVGVSYRSPADKLDKTLGIRIADGRLFSNRPGRNFRVRANTLDDAVNEAVRTMFSKQRKVYRRGQEVMRPFVPDWLHEAVVEKQRKFVALKSR